ncbi:MAG: type IV pilin protein [Salinisphaeraceae bacterium]
MRIAPSDVQTGFSLLELMIVVALISILVCIAIPGYQTYVQTARQTDAQRFLLEMSSRIQTYRLSNRIYPAGLGSDPGQIPISLPDRLDDYYSVSYTLDANGTPPVYRVTATPVPDSPQASRPELTLVSNGLRSPASAWK